MAYVKVEGIVGDHLGAKGFRLLERITTITGQTFEKPWTVWGTQPHIGAFVNVSGELRSDVARHWETKELLMSKSGQPYVANTINDATIEVLREPAPAEAAQWGSEPSEQVAPF